ncbi:MAG: aminopeptidase family protein P, partial [Alphaproteobacteria bacterium]
HDDGAVELFIDRAKITPETEQHLGNHVSIAPPEALAEALERLAISGKPIQICPRTAASWIFRRVRDAGGEILEAPDPCELPKARKNAIELEGSRAAHRRDGAALSRFLSWLDEEAPTGALTEISAQDRLAAFRQDGEYFSGLSFSTISSVGPNGAINHYRVTESSNRKLSNGDLYLVDSGGQYRDGTTDITRTIAIGAPSDEMKDRFTRVLKGHIALACVRFPVGTSGAQLDTLARMFLWQAGLDYDHGTGHGVGSYLGVHEGPQRISKQGNVPLEAGMILSNEPGYYKEGAYGIRIENLVAVVAVPMAGAEREMLGFETLSFAPIDLTLVKSALLTDTERAWLNSYHEQVRAVVGPQLDGQAKSWLQDATRPI